MTRRATADRNAPRTNGRDPGGPPGIVPHPTAGAAEQILAVDPGPEESAFCILGNNLPPRAGKISSAELCQDIRERRWKGGLLAVEMVASYGMPVGAEVFETCVWIGRFVEAWGGRHILIPRLDVKLHLCHVATARDSNIRQALIDRFGGGARAIGGTRCPECGGKGWRGAGRPMCAGCIGSGWKYPPGPLHGFAGDCWSALAVAVTVADRLTACPGGGAREKRDA